MASLRYQLETALQDNFKLHFDKHADKKDKTSDNSHIIKSISSKNELSDFARTFTNFIKDEGYKIKFVKDIDKSICQAFIDKTSEGASEKTLQTYQAYFRKFEKVIYKTFGARVDFSTTINKDLLTERVSIKEYSFTREELDRILDTPHESESKNFVKFASFSGSRVQMCEKLQVRDITIINDNTVDIFFFEDKGSKNRVVRIENKPEFVNFCRDLRKGKLPQDKLFNIKKGSVETWISRRCKALSIKTEDGRYKSGNHSIRKLWAEEREKDYGEKQTLKDLGHGEERKSLIDTYIHSKK